MTVFELGAVGEFLGSLAVLVTLIYLAVQVRQNNRRQRHERIVSIQHGQNSVVGQLQDSSVVRAFAATAEGDVHAEPITGVPTKETRTETEQSC